MMWLRQYAQVLGKPTPFKGTGELGNGGPKPISTEDFSQLQRYQQSGQYREAQTLAEQLATQAHLTAAAHWQLGLFYQAMGQGARATHHYQEVLAKEPQHVAALLQLGHYWLGEQQIPRAIQYYEWVLQQEPLQADVWFHLGRVAEDQGDLDLAQRYWHQACQLRPDYLFWQLHQALAFPAIVPTQASIGPYLEHVDRTLSQYRQTVSIENHLPVLCRHNLNLLFQLNYLGVSETSYKQKLAEVFIPPSGPYFWPLPQPQPHIGFVVTRFHEGIFIKAMAGLVSRLPAYGMTVTVVCDPASCELLRPHLAPEVTLWAYPYEVTAALIAMRQRAFDILYWWEAGTDSLNYFWPFFRLAPLQCTSWGNAGTSGIPTMDLFLSAPNLDTVDGQGFYSERLVQLKRPPTYYLHVTAPQRTRADFGLPEQGHLYGCLQNLQKLHPDFDQAVAHLLAKDPDGYVVIVSSGKRQWDVPLQVRWQHSFGELYQRVLWLPEQPRMDFFALITQMDVMLEPFYFGAGSTAYEVFSLGVPWVTWEGPWLRGRIVATCYRQMQRPDCVATSQTHYVDRAYRLGNDAVWNQALRQHIQENHHLILENPAVVSAFAEWVHEAVAKGM